MAILRRIYPAGRSAARDRKPDDSPGGEWETNRQPRLRTVYSLIDGSTADAIEIWTHENVMGLTTESVRSPDIAV